MPFLDAYIPEGALKPDAERQLMAELSDLLMTYEGVATSNEVGRLMTWAFVHRPELYVGGAPVEEPRYRFICHVPEGQFDDERRAAVTAKMTKAVAEAEGGAFPNPELRTALFTCEVPDGWWSGGGRVIRLPDIYQMAWPLKPDMDGDPRETAEQILSERRREEAERILAAAETAGASS